MPRKEFPIKSGRLFAMFIVFALQLLIGPNAFSQTLVTMHHFDAQSGGTEPTGQLLADAAGNLYGATLDLAISGNGTIFELSPPTTGGAWTETVLYTFLGGTDGESPNGSLVADAAGNLYGTTYYGGSSQQYGTVFELVRPTTPGVAWTESVLYRFQGGTSDGYTPGSGLIFDAAGNLYGETEFGGPCNDGTILKLSPPASSGDPWAETILYSFRYSCTGADGRMPVGGLVFGKGGALFGTTISGTTVGIAGGTVFRLQPPGAGQSKWAESVIHNFAGGSDGRAPYGGVTFGIAGELYGTASAGGENADGGCPNFGCGIVFELSPPAVAGGEWPETILYSFTDGDDGASPFGRVILDHNGNIYGTTTLGGILSAKYPGGGGTVFGLTPPSAPGGNWTETTLHAFTGTPSDQGLTYAGVIFGKNNRLYGTLRANDQVNPPRQYGAVFKITP
jgi:uncharacterized repeat protein (TIGR03803 family)